jgi:hypothetical protein
VRTILFRFKSRFPRPGLVLFLHGCSSSVCRLLAYIILRMITRVSRRPHIHERVNMLCAT